jgi:hypothetical protein
MGRYFLKNFLKKKKFSPAKKKEGLLPLLHNRLPGFPHRPTGFDVSLALSGDGIEPIVVRVF